jgi:glucose uptake protein
VAIPIQKQTERRGLLLSAEPKKPRRSDTVFVVENNLTAVVFCVITMLCWGSWANTQKAVGKQWRFELFYWDYVFGVVLASLAFAFTFGSMGTLGRSFLADLAQADLSNVGSALLGGVVFNAANILLVAAIALSGMAVAFPVGIGLALVLGVLVNYIGGDRLANPWLLFLGVALVTGAIVLDAKAYRKLGGSAGGGSTKGLVLAVLCGVLMSTFYFLVGRTLGKVEFHPDPKHLDVVKLLDVTAENLRIGELQAGMLTAYTANTIFAFGILLSSLVFNVAIMKKPFVGAPVPLSDYFKGAVNDHLWGIAGGMIWAVGMTLNIAASGQVSPAVSYGLGQGATMVAAFWGVFVWREFRDAPRGTTPLLVLMFILFITGLGLVIVSRLTL